MSKWDKMDKIAFEKSEVMQELEKLTLETIARFEYLALKQAQSGLSGLKEESDAAKTSIDQTATSVQKLDTALDNINNAEDEDVSEEESKEAKANLVAEMTKMAHTAADSGDTILAYKIERAIQEIIEEV